MASLGRDSRPQSPTGEPVPDHPAIASVQDSTPASPCVSAEKKVIREKWVLAGALAAKRAQEGPTHHRRVVASRLARSGVTRRSGGD